MLNQNQGQQQSQMNTGVPPQQQFGGNELMGVHESMGSLTGSIEYYSLHEQYVQDQELVGIMQRQKAFLSQMYNTIIDTLKSGKDPAVKTQTYKMEEGNQTTYGMTPSTPKAPIQSINEIDDQCVSSAILGHLKGIASSFTTTALEATNPVLRRILADSIPNIIEMAFETYLYQNKNQYYQVPQLSQADMQAIINAHAPISGTMPH